MSIIHRLYALLAVSTLAASALVGCVAGPTDSDPEEEDTGEASQAIRVNAVEVDYFSDATYTTVVGYRIYGCNGITNWGQHTAFIEVDEIYACTGASSGGNTVGCYASGYCSAEYDYCVSC